MGGSTSLGNSFGLGGSLFSLAIAVFYIYVMWKVFVKAGYPGIAAIIPIYNIYIIFKMAKYSGWMMLLLFIPVVNLIVMILVYVRLSAGFGKDVLFAIGLFFLSFIFLPILAFGDADYSASRIN